MRPNGTNELRGLFAPDYPKTRGRIPGVRFPENSGHTIVAALKKTPDDQSTYEPFPDPARLADSTRGAAPSVGERRRTFLGRLGRAAGALWLGSQAGPLAAGAGSPRTYVVRRGDTLSEIAERYGTSVASLRNANRLSTDLIVPGQRLRLRGEPSYPLLASVRPEIAVSNLNPRRWQNIILHHSATAMGNAAIFDRYHRQQRHMENGLAYHFIIGNGTDSRDGEIEVGGRWERQIQGGHVRSLAYNENSIGICLVGDFEKTKPTSKQLAAALELVEFIKRSLLNGKPRLYLHRELKGEHTLCPGRNFPSSQFRSLRA